MQASWYDDGSSWYWFGSDGAMATGWRSIAGSWYYLDGSGAMVTGWLNENGSWYYFDDSGCHESELLDGRLLLLAQWRHGDEYSD